MLNNDDAPASTKACPCGESRLVLLRSVNLKLCPTCGHEINWPLDAGQRALISSSRADRRFLETANIQTPLAPKTLKALKHL